MRRYELREQRGHVSICEQEPEDLKIRGQVALQYESLTCSLVASLPSRQWIRSSVDPLAFDGALKDANGVRRGSWPQHCTAIDPMMQST